MVRKCHLCEYHHCANNNFSVCNSTRFCFQSALVESGEVIYRRGCYEHDFNCPRFQNAHFQCCDKDFCNDESFPVFALDQSAEYSNTLIFFASIFLSALLFISLFAFYYRRYQSKKAAAENAKNDIEFAEREQLNKEISERLPTTDDRTIREILDSSGSGSGYPILTQRTFAKQIERMECIGKGRYGEVWKGIFQSEEVAVKIFFTREELSWKREIDIYSTVMLKNENILPFIGSDVTAINACTQLWLVTAYYELGSLFDYLQNHTFTLDDMFSVMISIASGITHLHTEIFGTQGKPAIAHRDIKSKNILMKSPNTCCIADFGLAVTHRQTGSLDIAFNYRAGTKRYMAPEVLDGSFKESSFNSYMMADIYAFSLVLWEIMRRSENDFLRAQQYQVPYQDMVPSDPSFDDMKRVVCTEQLRPPILAQCDDHEVMKSVTNLIRETWAANPKSRLSALRVKKTLITLST